MVKCKNVNVQTTVETVGAPYKHPQTLFTISVHSSAQFLHRLPQTAHIDNYLQSTTFRPLESLPQVLRAKVSEVHVSPGWPLSIE